MGNNNSDIERIRLELLSKFGANSIIMGSDMEKATYGRVSTGSISLDLALGGGIPIGRMTQISGAKSTSKSSLCDRIIANAQKTKINWIWTERKAEKGREIVTENKVKLDRLICGCLDVEGTRTPDWTHDKLGVNMNDWIYSQPAGLEEGLEMALQMQKNGVHLILIDSIEALEPVKEYDTQMGDSVQMGIKPKLLGEYCRKYTSTNNKLIREGKLPCTVILINQLREKIGAYGDPEYTPGGRAIEFYISVDLRLRRGDWITEGKGENKSIIGQNTKFKSNKNKTYKQQQTGEFDFYFDDSEDGTHLMGEIDTFKEIVIEGIAWGVIERAGSWMKYKGENLAQGADNTIEHLKQHPDKFEVIKKDLFKLVKMEEEHLFKEVEKK
jgi:recombination protein RecA